MTHPLIDELSAAGEEVSPADSPQDPKIGGGMRTGLTEDTVLNIPVSIQVVIGSARLALSEVAKLGPNSVVVLDQKLGTPAAILVNGREVAKGDIFVLDGEGGTLGITITRVASGAGSSST